MVRAGVESPRLAGVTLSTTALPVSWSVAAVSVEGGATLTAGAVSVAGASPVRLISAGKEHRDADNV